MEKETMAATDRTHKEADFETETTSIWSSCNLGIEIQEPNVLNCDSDKLTSSFFNQNWDNSIDQSDPFESALSSIVSSPVAPNTRNNANPFRTDTSGVGDSEMIRELIGRLGNISSSYSGDVSPPLSCIYNSKTSTTNNTSCYTTPLNSPPKLNLSMMDSQIRGNLPALGGGMVNHPSYDPFQVNPGFAERAMYSCFGSRNLVNGGLNEQSGNIPIARIEPEKVARGPSSQTVNPVNGSQVNIVQESCKSLRRGNNLNSNEEFSKFSWTPLVENSEFGDSREGSSVSEQIPGSELLLKPKNEMNSRKRKPNSRGKAKETTSSSEANKAAAENEESNAKRSKLNCANEEEKNVNPKQNNNKDDSMLPEPPKDYIHVRARRGQATDRHSLAERVRREKISERMKYLQDLVPGCNKVTGKAVMLDEIINYVQSLQRQVEFLSMKLSTINPMMDFNMEALLSKDNLRSRGFMPHSVDPSTGMFTRSYQTLQGFPLQDGMPRSNAETQIAAGRLCRDSSMHLPPFNDGFHDVSGQVTAFWGDDHLQSVAGMGFVPKCDDLIPPNEMKIEH